MFIVGNVKYVNNKIIMKLIYCIFGLILLTLISCDMSILAVVDTNHEITVSEKISDTEFKVEYVYKDEVYFMHIISNEDWEVGDKLEILKKED